MWPTPDSVAQPTYCLEWWRSLVCSIWATSRPLHGHMSAKSEADKPELAQIWATVRFDPRIFPVLTNRSRHHIIPLGMLAWWECLATHNDSNLFVCVSPEDGFAVWSMSMGTEHSDHTDWPTIIIITSSQYCSLRPGMMGCNRLAGFTRVAWHVRVYVCVCPFGSPC